MNKRTVYSPAHVEMGGEIYKAIRAAMRMREDNFETNPHPFALASKMAGELGNAMYGLNTWSEGRHEEGDRLAEMCRKTHKFVMDLLDSEIRAIVDKQREREAEVLARNDYPVETGLKIRDMMHEVIGGKHNA
jgi:hypothetical protein